MARIARDRRKDMVHFGKICCWENLLLYDHEHQVHALAETVRCSRGAMRWRRFTASLAKQDLQLL